MKLLVLLSLTLALSVVTFAQTNELDTIKKQNEDQKKKLADWPNLKRYAEANSTVSAPAKGEERVVFMGDSITDGWKIAEYFPNKPYINRGIGGQTTPQMLIRFRPDVIAIKPKVVVILAGTNDIAGNTGPMTLETIENNYTSMAELAKANGIKVVFASVLPIHDYNTARKQSERRQPEQILKLNEWLKNYCQTKGHIYLDYFSKTVDDKGFLKAELANDGLHPNKAGYEIMAPLASSAIQTALKKEGQ